jgi:hypothetical protein
VEIQRDQALHDESARKRVDAKSDELLRGVRAAAGADSPLSAPAARALLTARRNGATSRS